LSGKQESFNGYYTLAIIRVQLPCANNEGKKCKTQFAV